MKARMLPLLALAVLAAAAAPVAAAARHEAAAPTHAFHPHDEEGMSSDWNGDTLVLEERTGSGGRVTIAPEGTLTIDGDAVPLDGDQRRLLQDFYGRYVQIEEEAVTLGGEGARLGVAGAALAARALAGVARLSRDDYDQEDLEREMEAAAARLEAKGNDLEQRGESIESLVDDLRAAAVGLRERIPALGALAWFRVGGDRGTAGTE